MAQTRDRAKAMADVTAGFKNWRPAGEVLREVTAVPTRFLQYDVATGVGGHPTGRVALLHGPSDEGKALESQTPVLTPDGWKPIAALSIGDMVIGGDGRPCTVIGVFPQGRKQLFEIEFSDGTTIECCDEHLWFTTTEAERNRGRYVRGPRPQRARIPTGVLGRGSVKSTFEILQDFTPGDHAIPLVLEVEFAPVGGVALHPYLLGLLLGDGSFVRNTVQFCKPELDLHARISALVPAGDRTTAMNGGDLLIRKEKNGQMMSATALALKSMGLLGLRSHEKFVPSEYLLSAPAVRLDLLRGLLDTDGHVTGAGILVEYTSTSPRLAEDVSFLAWSLGAMVVCDEPRRTTYDSRGQKKLGRPSTRLRITFPDSAVVPVASEKNLARWTGEREGGRYRTINRIKPSRVSDAVCIAVDSPDRTYVADGFVVTHNSRFSTGLGASFLERGHFFGLVDAERTATPTWMRLMMGGMHDAPGFVALPSSEYEKTVDSVRDFATRISEARKAGNLPPDTSGLVVVDSIRKLVPKEMMKRLLADIDGDAKKPAGKFGPKKKGVDGYGGRAAQIKAALNAAWMDELVPLLAETGVSALIIARESEGEDDEIKIGGGKALKYDSSLWLRVTRDFIWDDGPGDKKRVVGERHRITIERSKLSGKQDRVVYADFNCSNGIEVPEGFWVERDVLDEAVDDGVIDLRGSYYFHDGKRIGQGKPGVLRRLHEDGELLARVQQAVRTTTRKDPQ